MHSLTQIHDGRSEVMRTPLADFPQAEFPRRLTRIIRDLVQGVWRRRLLIILPVILMLPISIVAAIILPKAYMAKSLMQLQEASRENPFARDSDPAGGYRVQERFEGLRALFMSDRVLSRALGNEAERLSPIEREARIDELRRSLSLDLIGSDFIEVRLAGARPEGLGKTLEAVMASFLEALVPEHGGATAAQLMVNARRQELEALVRAKEEIRHELAALPGEVAKASQQLAAIEEQRREKGDALARVDAEIARLRSALGNPNDEQLQKEIAALPTGGAKETGASTDASQPAGDRARDLSALQTLSSLRQGLIAETRGLGADAAALGGQLSRFRELRDRLATLEKEIATAQEAHDDYARRFSGAITARSVGILKAPELIRIIDPPRDPGTASRSRILYVLSGLTASGLLGLGFAFVAERLDQRVRHADEAYEATGIPVLAVVRERGGHLQKDVRSGHHGRDRKPPRRAAAEG